MKKWSQYFQNPAFLELTRMNLIRPEFHPLILDWCGIKPGMKVLDVGCGTGYFTRYLGEGGVPLKMTGLEYDDVFVESARTYETSVSEYEYIQGDAHALPFADHSFDVVVSHTFLTSVPQPEKAMAEMKRVCKVGGIIGSVTAMSFGFFMYSAGHYPEECEWLQPLAEAQQKLQEVYEKTNPITNYLHGIKTDEFPYFFHLCGLKEVSAYPIGKIFSFSDASLPRRDRERYIELLYASEAEKLKNYLELPEFAEAYSAADAEQYLSLVKAKCDYLASHLDDNSIWELQGGANLLTVGKNPPQFNFSFLNK